MSTVDLDASTVPLGSFALTIENFLSPEECQALMAVAGKKMQKSGLLGFQRDNYRTSSGAWLARKDLPAVTGKIRQLVCAITGLPPENQEPVQVLHYALGQAYLPHQDFWHPNTDYYAQQMARGGQRAWSVMIYLNDVPRGGGTEFPDVDIHVTAERGKVLAWRNIVDGELNYDSLHAGLPVEEGEKWVAVTWVRELPFT